MLQYVISGVGRSGTTALYDMLKTVLADRVPPLFTVYEPLLWGPRTWNTSPQDFGNVFSSTESLHPLGLWSHCSVPLFTRSTDAPFSDLLIAISEPNATVLAKFIRASGRLDAILGWDQRVRIVHIVRNPLQVVNSSIQRFSFFGEEFHPSDLSRFEQQVASIWKDRLDLNSKDRAERSLYWWYYMNIAAIESAQRHPDRIVTISQEALLGAPRETIDKILDAWQLDRLAPNEPVGPGYGVSVKQTVRLNRTQFDQILPFFENYQNKFLIHTATRDLIDWEKASNRTLTFVESNLADIRTADTATTPLNATTVALRRSLEKKQRELIILQNQLANAYSLKKRLMKFFK